MTNDKPATHPSKYSIPSPQPSILSKITYGLTSVQNIEDSKKSDIKGKAILKLRILMIQIILYMKKLARKLYLGIKLFNV